ncbi:DegT/DnrJ/EryC1/StrS family aminotransferase [Candidatus Omnitrophota bacterium]
MKDKVIPHSRPTLGKEEAQAVEEVVRSGYIAQGDKVKEFEDELARFVGVKGAVVTNSGLSALHLGLVAMGIGPGDEVLLPSFVCSAILNAVYQTGAGPNLCDVELESFNISSESIKDTRTDNARAVIVPHMFGSPADLEKIEGTGIPIIEDCAHSIGAMYGDKRVGSVGRFSILSFYACKMIACGEGGAFLSNDEDLLQIARDRRSYDEKDHYKLRYNYKMTDIQAALGLVQLKKFPEMIKKRKELAARYDEAFKDMDIKLPRGEFDHVYYRYVIRTEKDMSGIKEKGVMAGKPVFKPLHRYLELRSGFKNTDRAYSTSLSIPIYPSLTEEEQGRVIEAVKDSLS